MGLYSAHWIDPYGKVLTVNTANHIDTIIQYPEKFGFTKEEVYDTYEKYKERVGQEGKAREELIKKAVAKGHIRTRLYRNFWSITVKRLDKPTKSRLAAWAEIAAQDRLAGKYAPVKIYELVRDTIIPSSVNDLRFELTEEEDQQPLMIVSIAEYGLKGYSSFNKFLNESSLTRLWQHMQNHDTGTITAFRDKRECGKGKEYTRKENLQRNKSLLSKLQALDYGITAVRGQYIENYGTDLAVEKGENVFFVVDLKNRGKLEQDLRRLGEEFDQDSILFMPKGGRSGSLIGTNHCPTGYPGYGKIIKLNQPIFGQSGEFFTRVKGRPFVLKERVEELQGPQGYFGKYALHEMAKRPWGELDV